MPLELVTARDERQCCMVERGERCTRTSAMRIAPAGTDEHEHELYAYTCRQHVEAVLTKLGPTYDAADL